MSAITPTGFASMTRPHDGADAIAATAKVVALCRQERDRKPRCNHAIAALDGATFALDVVMGLHAGSLDQAIERTKSGMALTAKSALEEDVESRRSPSPKGKSMASYRATKIRERHALYEATLVVLRSLVSPSPLGASVNATDPHSRAAELIAGGTPTPTEMLAIIEVGAFGNAEGNDWPYQVAACLTKNQARTILARNESLTAPTARPPTNRVTT